MNDPRLTPAGTAGNAVFARNGQILSRTHRVANGWAPTRETSRDEILDASAVVGRLEELTALVGEAGLAEGSLWARGCTNARGSASAPSRESPKMGLARSKAPCPAGSASSPP